MCAWYSDTFQGSGSIEDHVSDSGYVYDDRSFGRLEDGWLTPLYDSYSGGSYTSSSTFLFLAGPTLPETRFASISFAVDLKWYREVGGNNYIEVGLWDESDEWAEVPTYGLSLNSFYWGGNVSVIGPGYDETELEGRDVGDGLNVIEFKINIDSSSLEIRLNEMTHSLPINNVVDLGGLSLRVRMESQDSPAISEEDSHMTRLDRLSINLSGSSGFWTNIIRATEIP